MFAHHQYIQASFNTSCTISPIPSKISCSGASHIKAEVVTSLFFWSMWLSLTLLLTCLQPNWLMAAAVSVVPGYLQEKQSSRKGNLMKLTYCHEQVTEDLITPFRPRLLKFLKWLKCSFHPWLMMPQNNVSRSNLAYFLCLPPEWNKSCFFPAVFSCAQLDSLVILFNTDSDLTARKHLGSQNGWDAAEADRFALAVEGLQHGLNFVVNRAVFPLHGPCTQVLRCTKST